MFPLSLPPSLSLSPLSHNHHQNNHTNHDPNSPRPRRKVEARKDRENAPIPHPIQLTQTTTSERYLESEFRGPTLFFFPLCSFFSLLVVVLLFYIYPDIQKSRRPFICTCILYWREVAWRGVAWRLLWGKGEGGEGKGGKGEGDGRGEWYV